MTDIGPAFLILQPGKCTSRDFPPVYIVERR
jgi:hypothetical protein